MTEYEANSQAGFTDRLWGNSYAVYWQNVRLTAKLNWLTEYEADSHAVYRRNMQQTAKLNLLTEHEANSHAV